MQTDRKQPGPKLKLRIGINGGNRKPQTFRLCAQCNVEFGPLITLKQKFCSYQCKVKAQSTGIKTFRKTIPKARSAQRQIAYNIQSGKIVRPNKCEQCSKHCKAEAAHYNYDEPLNVRWLCRSCHIRWDKSELKNGTIVVARWEKFTGKKAELLERDDDPTPWCSYGHKTQKECDCGPIAEND